MRLAKTASPETPIPEIDLKDQVRAMAQPLVDKVATLERQMLTRSVEDNIMGKRNSLYEKGFKKDEVDQIEKLMVERQIPSHETAAEFFKMQKQTATPTPSTMTPITLPTNVMESMKNGGQSGMNQWARGEAYSVINDLKAGRTLV